MANYPTAIDSFAAVSGTSKLSSPDHAGTHNLIGASLTAVETVIGTSSGTNTLKNLSVGKFAIASAGGTLANGLVGTSTITGGTASGMLFGTSTITGGTVSAALIGTSQITGGSIAAAVIGTPDITGGTWTNYTFTGGTYANLSVTGTLQVAGTIAQTGAADHLTLTAGANKLVRTQVLRQEGTTNVYQTGNVVIYGWGQMLGDTSTSMRGTISFGVTFGSAPIVLVSQIGVTSSTAIPTTPSDFTNDPSIVDVRTLGNTAGSVLIQMEKSSGTFSTSGRYGYSWMAMGSI